MNIQYIHINSLFELKDKHISWHNPNLTKSNTTAANVLVHYADLGVKVALAPKPPYAEATNHCADTEQYLVSFLALFLNSPQICRPLIHTTCAHGLNYQK